MNSYTALNLDWRKPRRATHPDANFISVIELDPMVDLFSNVFPRDMRNGEVGLLPNGQIPGLEFYEGSEPSPKSN